MDPWKRRFLLETIISRFHVNFWGCTVYITNWSCFYISLNQVTQVILLDLGRLWPSSSRCHWITHFLKNQTIEMYGNFWAVIILITHTLFGFICHFCCSRCKTQKDHLEMTQLIQVTIGQEPPLGRTGRIIPFSRATMVIVFLPHETTWDKFQMAGESWLK